MRNYNSEKEDKAHIAVVNRKRIVETDEQPPDTLKRNMNDSEDEN